MKRPLIIALAAAAVAFSAAAGDGSDINSPQASGWLQRAAAMYADENYRGCLDQLQGASRFMLDGDQAEQALYLQALATVKTDIAAAPVLIGRYLAQFPTSPRRMRVLMALGDCYYGSDDARALAIYRDVDARALDASDRADLTYRKAFCLLQTGDLKAADSEFADLAKSKTYANAARYYRGYIAYARRDYAGAEKLLSGLNTAAAPSDMAPYYLSQIYFVRNDYRKAYATAKSLIRNASVAKPFLAEAYRVAGESAWHLGNESEAANLLRTYAGATDSPVPSALYILGLRAYESGDYAEAIELLAPATALEDAMAQSAYLYIGQARMRTGDSDAAIMAFDKALKLDFDPQVTENAYYNYAVASLDGGKVPFGSAVATFMDFLRRFPDSSHAPEVQKFVVSRLLSDGDYEAALDAINGMGRPTAPVLAAKQQVLYALGSRALAAGNVDKARTYLTDARKLAAHSAATDREVALALGEVYMKGGDNARAAALFGEYLRQPGPNTAVADYDMGYALFRQRRYADAAPYFAQAADSSLPAAARADALNRRADCMYYGGDFAAAAAVYDRAYSLDPAAGDYAMFQKAVMEGYQRNHKRKIQILNDLRERFPSSALIPDAYLELTESYIQLGDNDGAIREYRLLTSRYPNTAQGRQGSLQMALTLLNAGRRTEAVDAYKQVISLYPTSSEAAQAVAHLKRIAADDGTLPQLLDFIASVPGAPQVNPSEADALAFEAAEKEFLSTGRTARLDTYLDQHADGRYRAQALDYLANTAYEAGDGDRAYAYAAEIADKHPDSSFAEQALLIMAVTDTDRGRGNSAMVLWQRLADKASSPQMATTARLGMLRTGRELADNDAVIDAADALIASAATDARDKNEAIFSRAQACANKGDSADARRQWQTIAHLTDDPFGIQAAYCLAQSLYDDGDVAEAEKTASAITASASPHAYWIARAFILLSDIYAARGDEYKSTQYLKALRENYPGNEQDIFMMIEQRLK